MAQLFCLERNRAKKENSLMTTECNQFVFGFHPQKRREIRAQFDGGAITSDGGGLLLREVEKRIGIVPTENAIRRECL